MAKRRKRVYWGLTGLLAVFMLMASVPDLLALPQAAAFLQQLGYPPYLLQFLGIAKILGVVVVCAPAPRTLQEWAYAGLTIDLTGALYSHLSVGDPASVWMSAVIGLLLVGGSYLARGQAAMTEVRIAVA